MIWDIVGVRALCSASSGLHEKNCNAYLRALGKKNIIKFLANSYARQHTSGAEIRFMADWARGDMKLGQMIFVINTKMKTDSM